MNVNPLHSLRSVTKLVIVALVLTSVTAHAQTRFPSPTQRIRDLEKRLTERIDELEKEVERLEDEKLDAKGKKGGDLFSDGIVTIGDVELKLGGKIELLYIDTDSGSDAVFGRADEPDPHFELQRLRLAPRLRFNRHIEAAGQIDLKPIEGRLTLKEMTVRHRYEPNWWLRSTVRIGLDDRFIRPNRRTKTYPLVGNAFWRDESLGIQWALRIGDPDGPPKEKKKKKKKDDEETVDVSHEGGTEAEDRLARIDARAEYFEDSEPSVFDFSHNPGALTFFVSLNQTSVLNENEVGFDGAAFNEIVQDDRNLDGDLAISEVGFGLRYGRDFDWLGDLSILGFFYVDSLNNDSRDFLQQDLTVRDNGGVALAGYGDSRSRDSNKYGVGLNYFLPAETLIGRWVDTRGRDGLRIQGQWIRAEDGDLKRKGWYVMGSYRYSFRERLIAGRYLRSVEPLVRYGELDTNLGPVPSLPGTWDRERLVFGLITEVTDEVLFKIEYAINEEDTGVRSVDNDELMVELLLLF